LKEMAVSAAKQVIDDGHLKILEPMPPYERRIIHLILKDFDGIKTESQGEGQLRRVVIKPGSNAA
jgi:spoIIIJ-associated protein